MSLFPKLKRTIDHLEAVVTGSFLFRKMQNANPKMQIENCKLQIQKCKLQIEKWKIQNKGITVQQFIILSFYLFFGLSLFHFNVMKLHSDSILLWYQFIVLSIYWFSDFSLYYTKIIVHLYN